MKKLVWLLVLINIGLFAYFNKESILPSAPTAAQKLSPEKIIVLSQSQIETLPKKSAPSSVVAAMPTLIASPTVTTAMTEPTKIACYEWGVFSTTSAATAQSMVSTLSLQATIKKQSALEAKHFWVYKPPLKSDALAQAKVVELRALGIQELFIVQEPKWRNAISFGVFEDEKLALKLLAELKAKGVKNVVKALRTQGKEHTSLIFTALSSDKLTELRKLKPQFPEANLKEVACQ